MSLLSALNRPQAGVIRFDGTPLTDIRIARYCRRCVTTIFQKFDLLPYVTVIENVMYPGSSREKKLPPRSCWPRSISRRGCGDCSPTGNLDEANGRRVADILVRLARDEGKTVIMVPHDTELAQTADVRYVLRNGHALNG